MMKRFIPLSALLAALLVLLPPPAQARTPITELNSIVAVVNNGVITSTELNRRVDQVVGQLRQQNTQLPPMPVLRKQVLDRMVQERLELQLADQTGVQVSDEQVNRVITRIAAQNGMNFDQFQKALKQQGIDAKQFRKQIRDQVTIARLRANQINNKITVTPQEIDAYLRQMATSGQANEEYHIAHILIAVPEAASPKQVQAAHAKALKVLKALHGGADFAHEAVAYSDGQEALKGGDMGWVKAGQLPPMFTDAITRMKPGQVSDPIRSPTGFHIIKLLGKRSTDQHMVVQTHARHILIKTSPLMTSAMAKAKLERLRSRIVDGASFAALAKANSDDTGSAAKGGDLGWITPGQVVPAFQKAMDKLKPGQISQPFQSRFGWHIVQVLGRRKENNTEAERRAKAAAAIRQRKIQEQTQDWLRRLREDSYVEYHLHG